MSFHTSEDCFDGFILEILPKIRISERAHISIGPILVALESNRALEQYLNFFRPVNSTLLDPLFRLVIVHCDPLDNELIVKVKQYVDKSYTGGRFSKGYYITDNFGSPIYLVSRGDVFYVFGAEMTRVFWSFFVKYFLTLFSIRKGCLHIKSSCIEVNGHGALIVGNGGTGKTILVSALCTSADATFVSNTHTLIDGNIAQAVKSSMRIRRDFYFHHVIDDLNLPLAPNTGEYVLHPDQFFLREAGCATIKNICLVDYSRDGGFRMDEIRTSMIYEYMEQFSLAINAYSLKNQILDLVESDVARFADIMESMKSRLRDVINNAQCYYLVSDVRDPEHRQRITEALS